MYSLTRTSIRPFSIIQLKGRTGAWSLSQLSLGERQGTPWAGCQSITGPHRDKQDTQSSMLTLTPWDNLESPIILTCMFLDSGRKLEYPQRTHAYTGRTCKPHRKAPPGTLSLWGDGANHHSTVQPHGEATTTFSYCALTSIKFKLPTQCPTSYSLSLAMADVKQKCSVYSKNGKSGLFVMINNNSKCLFIWPGADAK